MADRRLDTLSKGLKVIQKFVFEKETWGTREIDRGLGLSKSTALRILQTLRDHNFLNLSEQDHKYTIGPELWRLGVGLKGQMNLSTIATSILRKYANAINETMHFFTYAHGQVIFEEVVECTHSLRFHLKLGTPYGITRGAAGKVILAFLPPEEMVEILKKLKKDPRVQLDKLRKQVEQVKTNGYSCTIGERVKGLVGFAAPILGFQGVFLGGIGLAIPEVRYRAEDHKKFSDLVKSCAGEVSFIAGFTSERTLIKPKEEVGSLAH